MKLSKQLFIALTSVICSHSAFAQSWTNPDGAVWYMNTIKHEAGLDLTVMGQIQNEIQVRDWAIKNQKTYIPTLNAQAWKNMKLTTREIAKIQQELPELLK
jgi:hypothetical protein